MQYNFQDFLILLQGLLTSLLLLVLEDISSIKGLFLLLKYRIGIISKFSNKMQLTFYCWMKIRHMKMKNTY